jgi:hypothetical protein
MAQNSLIKTVSITKEQEDFLNEHTDLSLSKICQSKINELMERNKFSDLERQKLLKNISSLQELLEKATTFIDEKGFWGEFVKK